MEPKRLGESLFAVVLLASVAIFANAQKPGQQEAAATTEPAGGPSRVIVPIGTHLPLVLQNTINTRSAKPGDQVYFETVYPITVGNRIVIPAGSFVRGSITQAKRPGRIKGRGQIFVRFDSLTLPNGYTVPLSATVRTAQGRGEERSNKEGTIVGEPSKGHDVGTVGTTTATGAIIGAAAGSGKGAAIGAGAGATAGLIGVLLTRGREVELPRGSTLEVMLERELSLDANMVQFDSAGHPSALPGPTPADRTDRRVPRRPRPYGWP